LSPASAACIDSIGYKTIPCLQRLQRAYILSDTRQYLVSSVCSVHRFYVQLVSMETGNETTVAYTVFMCQKLKATGNRNENKHTSIKKKKERRNVTETVAYVVTRIPAPEIVRSILLYLCLMAAIVCL
jgi:hypothetical protein